MSIKYRQFRQPSMKSSRLIKHDTTLSCLKVSFHTLLVFLKASPLALEIQTWIYKIYILISVVSYPVCTSKMLFLDFYSSR